MDDGFIMPGKAVAEACSRREDKFFSNKQKKEDVRAGNVEREQGNEAEVRGYDDNAGSARVGYGESQMDPSVEGKIRAGIVA